MKTRLPHADIGTVSHGVHVGMLSCITPNIQNYAKEKPDLAGVLIVDERPEHLVQMNLYMSSARMRHAYCLSAERFHRIVMDSRPVDSMKTMDDYLRANPLVMRAFFRPEIFRLCDLHAKATDKLLRLINRPLFPRVVSLPLHFLKSCTHPTKSQNSRP